MKKNKLSRIANTLVFFAIVFALFMIVATIALNGDGVYLESFTGIIIAFSVLGFALALMLVIGLQEIEEKRTLVLKPEDIKPGTVIEVLDNNPIKNFGKNSHYIYKITDLDGEKSYLLEVSHPLMMDDDGYLVKVETGNFSPHKAYINPES